MLLARFEAFYSRPVAPTRRLALGDMDLPADSATGFGGILLGGIAARFAPELDPDLLEPLYGLLDDVEEGFRIAQPRIRHRLQSDRVGLQPCRHLLVAEGEQVRYRFHPEPGTAAQHILCAVYAAQQAPRETRSDVTRCIRKGLIWHGECDHRLMAHLGDRSVPVAGAIVNPLQWAIETLSLVADAPDDRPGRGDVQQAYREALRDAHPDHGGAEDGAADRIAELVEARKILLAG